MRIRPLLSLALLVGLVAPSARADFEIVLREGGKVIAESYQVRGEKLLVYKSTGMLEFDRARVESVRERGSEESLAPSPPTKGGSLAPAEAPRTAVTGDRPPVAAAVVAPASAPTSTGDVRAREHELTNQIIDANRDLLFARNRGEAQAIIDEGKKKIDKLEAERSAVRKQAAAH